MPRSKPAIIITSLFAFGLVLEAVPQPQIIRDLKSVEDNKLVEQLVEEHYNVHRNRYLGPTHFKGANLYFNGSVTVGVRSPALLGNHVFSRVYDRRTGETQENRIYFVPSIWRIVIAALVSCVLFFGLSRAYPSPKSSD